MQKINVTLLGDALDFVLSLPDGAQRKIYTNINRVASGTRDAELFKKLTSEIWEFRTKFAGIAYRLLAFWDKDNETLIVATHGFIKKTQKTPKQEIAKAEKIREAYFHAK